MKKVLNWFINHLVLVVGILVFIISLGIVGGMMLKSKADYKDYEANYDLNDLEVRSMYDAQPKRIEIADNFVSFNDDGSVRSNKSGYKNAISIMPEEFTVTTTQSEYIVEDGYVDLTQSGGKIALKFTLEEKSFVDIAFVLSSQNKYTEDGKDKFGVKDLLSNVNFVINGQTMEDDINLTNPDGESPEWHNLVMVGFALPAGDVNVSIQSVSGKNGLMPHVKNIAFFSTQPLTLSE